MANLFPAALNHFFSFNYLTSSRLDVGMNINFLISSDFSVVKHLARNAAMLLSQQILD